MGRRSRFCLCQWVLRTLCHQLPNLARRIRGRHDCGVDLKFLGKYAEKVNLGINLLIWSSWTEVKENNDAQRFGMSGTSVERLFVGAFCLLSVWCLKQALHLRY